MYCINCGEETKAEDIYCPHCGKPLQMVPDYSIYDENDINVILESTIDVKDTKPTTETKQAQETENSDSAPKKDKKMDTKKIIILTIVLCVLILGVSIGIKSYVDYKNSFSYDYQMKAGDEAFFKNKLEQAESHYLQALTISSADTKARIKLADVYLEKGNSADAISLLSETIAIDANNYDAYKRLFQLYEAEGNTDAIIALKRNVTNDRILKLFEDYIVNKPVLNLPSGNYSEVVKLAITADKGLQIYYTMDGSSPISNGILYTGSIEISAPGMNTVKAVTKNDKGVYSDIASETYMIKYNAPADPEVSPDGGMFTTPSYVYITVPEGCSAYYTWDRTDPNTTSSKYVSPLLIPEGYNILSVIIVNDTTGLTSGIYRGVFEYTIE